MACDTQINSLQFLRNKNIINDVNKILNESEFDQMNYKLTRLAEAKYGLSMGGLLFNKLESKQWDRSRSTYMRDAKYSIKFAEANSSLFDQLDKLVKEYENNKPDEPPMFMRQPSSSKTKLASTIFELIPDITDKQIKNIYDNYVKLISIARKNKEIPFDVFKNLLRAYQVYNYKDTYIFGNWDRVNGVFVTRVNSSPSSKELLAEAIPNLVEKGLDFISFVPEDVAKKYERSGYQVSKSGFDYNFKGEDMLKYAAISNPTVALKIFNKPLEEVTGEDLEKYNDSFNVSYAPLSIDADAINQAGKDVSKILQTYLSNFGITVKDIAEMKKRVGVDELGFADILSKIAYIKDKKDLPPVAGEFIAYMMQYNPLIKDIIIELSKTNDYKGLNKSKYFKVIGELIAADLQNKVDQKYGKSLIDLIKELISRFFSMLKNVDFEKINTNIGIISNNILQQNKNLVTSSIYKPGAIGQPTKQVNIEDALKKDKFGAEIIYSLSKKGFILTGSTALSKQGTIKRPDENPLHDIDWVSPFDRAETEEKFKDVFPDAIKVREIISEDRTITDSFIIAPKNHSVKNLVISDYTDNKGVTKSIISSYEVVNKKGKVVGTYNKVSNDEIVTGVEAKVIDFFVYENYSSRNRNEPLDYQSSEGTVIKLANWKDTFAAKLEYARYKDIWDYNRFIPNINVLTKEDYIKSGDRANSTGDTLTSNDLTDKNIWEELVREDKAFRLNDGTYVYQNSEYARKMPDQDSIRNERAKEIASILADRLAQNLGVNYERISAEEAQDLLKYTITGYNNEAAFFFGGTVYIVGDNITLNTVLHEFSHPLLGGIRRDNNKLFQNLYSKLMTTSEGQRLYEQVKANYPELNEESDLFKEEVLAYALQYKAYDKVTGNASSSKFNDFIKNILFAIKQFLRQVFTGPVNVSKLDLDTSLEDLAEMLLTKDFEFATPDVTDADIAQFARFEEAKVKVITDSVSSNALRQAINSMYSINIGILDKASKFKKGTKEYDMLKSSLLIDSNAKELIPAIQKSLAGYQTLQNKDVYTVDEIVQDAVEAEKKRLSDLNNRATSLVTSLDIIKNIASNMTEDLKKLKASGNFSSREGITMLSIYKSTSRAYAQLTKSIDKLFEEDFGLTTNNPFSDLLNSINQDLLRNENLIRGMYSTNNIAFYVELTGTMNEFLENELKENLGIAIKGALTDAELEKFYDKVVQQNLEQSDLDNLVSKGVNIKYVNEFIDRYNYFVVSPQKIKDIISGNTKDVSFLNRFLESYSSSNDPIVGSLAIWIQDQKTSAQQEALSKSHKLRSKLETLLPKIGFSPLDTTKIAELVTIKDKKLGFDKDGKPIMKEVMTFMNEFKDYRYDYDLYDYELEQALESGDKDKIKEAADKFRKLKKDYFWDTYKPEVYEKDSIFDKSPIGKLAWLDRKLALDEFNAESNKLNDEFERFESYSSTQALWRKYQQLYALTYEDGTPKVDDPENNIYDLSKAMILREHREATRKYYEFVEKPGALQTAYNQFVSLLEGQGIEKNSDEYEAKLKQWIKQNTRVAYSPKFYESRGELINRLQELQSKMNATFDVSAAYQDIYDIIFVFKDEQGQPIPEDLGADRLKKIKDIQQKVLDFKFSFDQATGLTKDEANELDIYMSLIRDGIEITDPEMKVRIAELIEKQESSGLTGDEVQEMNDIISELSDLSRKIPTEYYMDVMNEYMSLMELPQLGEDEVNDFINSSEMAGILETNATFSKWFFDNHVIRKSYNKYGKITSTFERSPAYSISVPTDPEHFLETKVIDNETGEEITIPGLPNARHSIYRIKNEYRTIPIEDDWKQYIGKYVDNQGNFLPRMYNSGQKNSAVDNKYINEDYLRLKQSNSLQYQLLEALKEHTLYVQDGKAKNSKLYLDVPRYSSRDVLEAFQSGETAQRYKDMKAKVSGWWDRTFSRSADDFENNLNYDPKNNLINTDLNGDEVAYVPVTGLYNLDYDKTSKDVLGGLIRYTASLETQSKLIETLPIVNSILDDLGDPSNQPKNTEKGTLDRLTGLIKHPNKKGVLNARLGQVQSLIEREYYGKNTSDFDQSNVVLSKFMGNLQKWSSRASLGMNIPAALKNRYGQIVQNIIESAGGEFVGIKDLALARPWAFKMMTEWSVTGIYTTGRQSLQVQMLMAFDPTFRSKEAGRSINRHMLKDLLNGEWLMSVNKFGEMEAALQLYGAFMYKQKVEQRTSKGETIMIKYMDAWELDQNGELTLKSGIDPEWSNREITHTMQPGEKLSDVAKRYNITVEELKAKNKLSKEPEDGTEIVISKATKFKQFKNRFQAVSRRLYGAYDDFGTPEGNKYLGYRMFFFMRKWIVPMFVNKLGAQVDTSEGILKMKLKPRYDWALGKPTQGYYITTLKFIKEAITSKGQKFKYMTAQEKVDLKRTGADALFIIGLALAAGLLFGYDDDDEDRWKKLQAKSGALFTDEFNPGGFMANHALYLMLGIQSETSAFIPISKVGDVNFGLDDYTNFLTGSSVAFGNTLVLYASMMQDILNFITFNDVARYKRDAGPYWWQQKDELKVWGHALKAVGITGSSGNPETLLKNLERSGTVK